MAHYTLDNLVAASSLRGDKITLRLPSDFFQRRVSWSKRGDPTCGGNKMIPESSNQ